MPISYAFDGLQPDVKAIAERVGQAAQSLYRSGERYVFLQITGELLKPGK